MDTARKLGLITLRRIASPWLRAVSLGILLLLSACGREQQPLQAQLLSTIESIQQAAKDKDLGDLMQHVSTAYLDSEGRTWKDVQRIAQFEFFRHHRIYTYKLLKEMNIVGDEFANAVILVAIAGQPIDNIQQLTGQQLNRMRADLMRFDVAFTFAEHWQVSAARWQRAQLEDFLP